MTQIFANRPELMPVGETTQEHKRWQEEESALVERDRGTAGLKGGLFRGCFRRTRRRQWAAIRDDGDGVNRCPACLWELEDGICPQCGSSDSDGHGNWDDDPYGIDGASIDDVLGVLDEDARMGRSLISDVSEHGYSSEDGSSVAIAPRVERFMGRRITRHYDRDALPEEEPEYDSFLDDTDENSQDDEATSLEGFVVNDVEDGQHSTTSSARSLHWETDEGTDEEANQQQDHDNDRISQDEDGSNETASAIAQYDPEEESDEGPFVRRRQILGRSEAGRSEASTQSSGSDGRGGSGVSQALNALRVRNGDNGSRISANAQRNIPRRNPNAWRERSADGTIEIESDSESPVPAQHTWRRRRAMPNRPIPDDDSEVEVSSGTATVGRESPRAIAGWSNSRSEGTRMARQTNNASSPIRIESSPTSPTRSTDGQFAVPGAFPQHSRPHTSLDTTNSRHISRTSARTNRGEGNSFPDTSTRPPPANASPSNGLQRRRGAPRRSPLPPRTHQRSPTPTQSHSPTGMEIFEQRRRERQARRIERRVERRRLKAEREMRGRPQSGLSLSPGPSNQQEYV